MALVNPHGKEKTLRTLLLAGEALGEEKKKAQTLPRLTMTSRETSDLIMLGFGAVPPLEGFMGQADWKGVCDDFQTADRVFWPIPITLSASRAEATRLKAGQEIALVDEETGELMGTMAVRGKYAIDKAHE